MDPDLYRRKTVAELLASEMPPRFWPPGTQFPYREKGRCRWCGESVQPPRRTWCSDACVREWTIRSSGSFVRSYVWERDHGVCAECGVDCSGEPDKWGRKLDMWGPWDADHIVPVWRGGGLCGLDGYQTLCRDCHARKTAADAAERAELRRPEPEPSPQMELVW